MESNKTDHGRESMSDTAEVLHCPKCGSQHHGPYALLGHIYTNHWITDEPPQEVKE